MIKKFRIWDAFQQKMSYGDKGKDLTVAFTNGKLSEVSLDDNERSCGWSAVPIDLERGNRYFAQQWTGLTDSTGMEIYEGDIVERRGKVTEIKFFSGDDEDFQGFDIEQVFGKQQIIGNIFQTPELLEKC